MAETAQAVERTLAKLPEQGPGNLVERDAAAIAKVARKYWGDQAPEVLSRAVQLAKE